MVARCVCEVACFSIMSHCTRPCALFGVCVCVMRMTSRVAPEVAVMLTKTHAISDTLLFTATNAELGAWLPQPQFLNVICTKLGE